MLYISGMGAGGVGKKAYLKLLYTYEKVDKYEEPLSSLYVYRE